MSSAAARDPQLERRFLAWLREREEGSAPQGQSDLDALASLDGLARTGPAFVQVLMAAGLDDELTERLIGLHAAWSRFRRDERDEDSEIAWVDSSAEAGGPESVTWVDEGASPFPGPSGSAPSLLAPGARALRPERPVRGLWRLSDLVVPIALIASVLLLLIPSALEHSALRELRGEAVIQLGDELSRGLRPERLQLQADHGAWLSELRSGQLRVLNLGCEGGPSCRARHAELGASQALAGQLVADAASWGKTPNPAWRPPPECFARQLQHLEAELAPGDPEDVKAALLAPEIAWLKSEAAR